MGDSGYHMEAQRKARMLQKKNEAMARIQQLQQGNFNSVTYNPTVGDCLQMQGPHDTYSYSMNRTNNSYHNGNNSFRSTATAAQQQLQQLPLLAFGQQASSSRASPFFSSRPSSSGGRHSDLRSVTPVQLSGRFFQSPSPSSGRPMTGGSTGFSPESPPQTPGLEELLGQQRSVYSTDLFPEYEDDRELFDTFTYI